MDRIDEIIFGMDGVSDGFNTSFTHDEVRKGMEQYAKEFVVWLSENTTIVTDYPNITLYRYHNRHDGWGNYTLDDIYIVFTEEINK